MLLGMMITPAAERPRRGLVLALVASGLALVFGVLDIVNFAQGELFMLGGYVLFFIVQLSRATSSSACWRRRY